MLGETKMNETIYKQQRSATTSSNLASLCTYVMFTYTTGRSLSTMDKLCAKTDEMGKRFALEARDCVGFVLFNLPIYVCIHIHIVAYCCSVFKDYIFI
jgi:hypothetical protein